MITSERNAVISYILISLATCIAKGDIANKNAETAPVDLPNRFLPILYNAQIIRHVNIKFKDRPANWLKPNSLIEPARKWKYSVARWFMAPDGSTGNVPSNILFAVIIE